MKRYDIEFWRYSTKPGEDPKQVAQMSIDIHPLADIWEVTMNILKVVPCADYANIYTKGRFYMRINK